MPRALIVFAILAVSQVIGWGAVGFLAAVASAVAEDIGLTLPGVFLGTSVMFVAMGLGAPLAGRGFARFGVRRVMAAGALLIGVGLAVIAAAQGRVVFLAGWAVVGAAGAMFLTTAAYVYLSDFAGELARGTIGTLMLVTGLAGSLFWPVTAWLEQAIGWRGAALAYAGTMAALVAPLVLLGLPETHGHGASAAVPTRRPLLRERVFLLILAAVALNGFVTFGIEAVGIELFRALGADTARAVAIASLLGVFKVGGRLIDLAGGHRWDGLSTAILAGAMIPLGLLAVAFGGATGWAVAGYLGLFGIGSGAFAVARATMPLTFYRRADYAATMSAIALPLNLINALAAPALAALLVTTGPRAVLVALAVFSAAAWLCLLQLGRLRPGPLAADGVRG
ncbi:MFS transporter [Pseudooceanicola sp. LIPI14-2-Ac024]|uniref:MFS transporter n=1 Tax=Pseudooceanicola sp. LIPI14-2-Ac024 TaxID=3344875 RepID=UPI0035CF1DEB